MPTPTIRDSVLSVRLQLYTNMILFINKQDKLRNALVSAYRAVPFSGSKLPTFPCSYSRTAWFTDGKTF